MLWARESTSRNPISHPRSRRPAARNNRRKSSSGVVGQDAAGRTRESDHIMAEPVYRRVVIKLSGEYFAGAHSFGMDQPTIYPIAGDLIAAKQLGVDAAAWCGGRSMWR